ncbi:hypothetical protein [Mycolicibacterium elephantis]|uniref:hypothetical protein n=1 Tax=Mycolicibacterium elephantis TaxID=81858 RepID=UPI000FE1EABA|nr:hypothetical protein [Mycolicibacterium elephantis]MCV7223151.1 hypothetical protein [Mycolicibacterium elephantis]
MRIDGCDVPVDELVVSTFHGWRPLKDRLVEHLNSDTLDCSADNVRWVDDPDRPRRFYEALMRQPPRKDSRVLIYR